MATGAIYIHTRDRLAFLERTLPKWPRVTPARVPIYLVVEPTEYQRHKTFVHDMGLRGEVGVIRIPGRNLGMGNSRNVAFRHAWEHSHKSFITTDDDLFPVDNPEILLKSATKPGVFGIGCYFSIYGMMLDGLAKGDGVVDVGTSIGMRCMALNTALVKKVGGFPIEWKGYDDQEMARRGIAQLGLPWKVDADFACNSIAKRGDPGGMASLPGYSNPAIAKHRAHSLAEKQWPDYTSSTERCDVDAGKCSYSFRWKKFRHDHGVFINDEE